VARGWLGAVVEDPDNLAFINIAIR
jgi:hypothetical protein